VKLLGELLRRLEALALLGQDVNDHRLGKVLRELENADEQRQIMAVDRADVFHAQFLEDQAAAGAALAVRAESGLALLQRHIRQRALDRLLGFVPEADGDLAFRHATQQTFQVLLQLRVARVRDDLVQVAGDGADVLVDAPLVVVEDADEFFRGGRNVVQRLVGNAVGQRGIAEDAHHVFVRALLVAGGAHAERRGKGGARVARAVAVVRTLGAQGKAVQAVRLADRVEAVLAAGEQLVDVALVAHVPDKLVLGRAEDLVQRDGQFDDAEVGAEMAARLGEGLDEFLADVRRQLLALFQRELLYVFRAVNHVEVTAHCDVGSAASSSRGNGCNSSSPAAFFSSF
jgi:hypothetical protein